MSSRWWYGVAAGTSVWAVFTLVVGEAGIESALEAAGVGELLTLAALLSWPLIPVALYLDVRRVRSETAWSPTAALWVFCSLFWISNVAAGTAYCLRRASAVRDEVPGERWYSVVRVGLAAWAVIFAIDGAGDHYALGPVEAIAFSPLLIVVWIGFPVALYLDAARVSGYTDWDPPVRPLVAAAPVPLVNVLAGVIYLYRRRRAFREADDPDTLSLADADGADDANVSAERSNGESRWYRRATATFVVYVFVLIALASQLSLSSEMAWNALALVTWPLFGIVFTGCLHYDLRTLRSAGVDWGPTRYLYYFSLPFPGPAFWYLIRRMTIVQRYDRRELFDDGADSGRSGGNGSDGNGSSGNGSCNDRSGSDPGASRSTATTANATDSTTAVDATDSTTDEGVDRFHWDLDESSDGD